MPTDVRTQFEAIYGLEKVHFLSALNTTQNAVSYLASFAKFISEVDNQEWRKKILKPLFSEFVNLHIKSYSDYSVLDLHFVGSIAYICRDVLEEVLQSENLEIKSILRRPIDGLVEYYKKKENG